MQGVVSEFASVQAYFTSESFIWYGVPIIALINVFLISKCFSSGWAATCSAILVLGIWYIFPILLCGHFCNEGRPPALFFLLFAVPAAFLVYVFFERVHWVLLPCLLIYLISAVTSGRLASAYHAGLYTGNPDYARSAYWHTFLTGLRERKLGAAKTGFYSMDEQ